jgi:hypothetical protein
VTGGYDCITSLCHGSFGFISNKFSKINKILKNAKSGCGHAPHTLDKFPKNTREREHNSRIPAMACKILSEKQQKNKNKITKKFKNLTWWSILTLEETSRNLTNLRPAKANDSIV